MRRTIWGIIGASIALCSPAGAQQMRLVGRSDLGGAGLNGEVTIVGTTAIVAAGLMPAAGVHAHLYNPYPCPAVAVKLVDLSEPRAPRAPAHRASGAAGPGTSRGGRGSW